jgi:cell division protein FtsN
MEKSEKFFIFTWKELTVIVLLMLTLVGFFFTLGLHYGKQIAIPTHHAVEHDATEKPEESPASVPPKEHLEEGSSHAKPVLENTIKEETVAEVEHSGVKIEQPKATALPTEKAKDHAHAEPAESESAPVAAISGGSFFVQLGSYTTKKEAQAKIKAFSKIGVKTEIQIAEVNHVTRFRVVISGFKSRPAADQYGRELKQKHKVDSYIVIK